MIKKNDYQELLKDPRWIKKRNQILSRDKNTCQFCGCQDKYMQVHHKRYIKGNKPWEYEDKDLITLCNRCHGYITDEKIVFTKVLLALGIILGISVLVMQFSVQS